MHSSKLFEILKKDSRLRRVEGLRNEIRYIQFRMDTMFLGTSQVRQGLGKFQPHLQQQVQLQRYCYGLLRWNAVARNSARCEGSR